jgi:endonuclease/exonuclease/phosphatase family metal-dependent hydrolase
MKILTQNCFGIPDLVSLLKRKGTKAERFGAIADNIALAGYDIVCLQEVFWQGEQELFRKTELHPSYRENKTKRTIESGLVTLTKERPLNVTFHKYQEQGKRLSHQISDRILGKGFLETVVSSEGRTVRIINTHTVSTYNDDDIAGEYLGRQVEQLAEHIEKQKETGAVVILAGDLNFRRYVKGSSKVLTEAYQKINVHLPDLTTSLSQISLPGYRGRIDYIFASEGKGKGARYVMVHRGQIVSDHPGIHVDIDFS